VLFGCVCLPSFSPPPFPPSNPSPPLNPHTQRIKFRHRTTSCSFAAGDLFLAAVKPVKGKDVLVGYVCGTLTSSPGLTHESMARHDLDGTLLCVHSVCVDEGCRRSGIAKRMLAAYLLFVQQTSPQVPAAESFLTMS